MSKTCLQFYAQSVNCGSVILSLSTWTSSNRDRWLFATCMVRECLTKLVQPTFHQDIKS